MFFVLFLLFVQWIEGRPVSYPDGWTIMQKNDAFYNRLHVHYSPDAYNSLGLFYEKKESISDVLGVQWNRLLWRKNTSFSQANIYLKLHFSSVLAGYEDMLYGVGVAGDWETRRLFASYEGHIEKSFAYMDLDTTQNIRLGVAPYVSEYGSLHTWLMLQYECLRDRLGHRSLFALIIRMFKGDYLWEIGLDQKGHPIFNWVVRF